MDNKEEEAFRQATQVAQAALAALAAHDECATRPSPTASEQDVRETLVHTYLDAWEARGQALDALQGREPV
jgi:hypothetical protein